MLTSKFLSKIMPDITPDSVLKSIQNDEHIAIQAKTLIKHVAE